MGDLTDRWYSWLQHKDANPEGDLQTVKFVEREILPEMVKDGFHVPTRRSTQSTLEAGLEPLPVVVNEKMGKEVRMCSFVYFLNLLWSRGS